MGVQFQRSKMKKFWRRMVVMVQNMVNILNATELYTEKNG